jgi:senataxin
MKCRTLTCAPTTSAVLEVTKRLLRLVRESLEYDTNGLGDIILFGNGERLKIDGCDDLRDVFLDYHADVLGKCLALSSGWKHCLELVICFLEDPTLHYNKYLEQRKEKNDELKQEKSKSNLVKEDDDELEEEKSKSNLETEDNDELKQEKSNRNLVKEDDDELEQEKNKSNLVKEDDDKLKQERSNRNLVKEDDDELEQEKSNRVKEDDDELNQEKSKSNLVKEDDDELEQEKSMSNLVKEDDDELKQKKSNSNLVKEDGNTLTFEEFVKNSFSLIHKPLEKCMFHLYTHLPTSLIPLEIVRDIIRALDLNTIYIFNDFEDIGSSVGCFSKLSSTIKECLHLLRSLSQTFSVPNFLTEKYAIKNFCLANACLVFCTASSSAKLHTEGMRPLELLVIDEAAQLKECESAIPLQLSGLHHAILIGDERQLPAMVQSKV